MEQYRETIDQFVAAVETYTDRIDLHADDVIEETAITDYIETTLVPAWQNAEETADELHQAMNDPDGPEELSYLEANRLWLDYIEAEQTITAHEEYACETYAFSPVQHRLSIDGAYRDRIGIDEV